MRWSTSVAVALVLLSCHRISLATENWPQWRGPLGSGVAASGDYPVKFSASDGVAWKVELPGRGTSTPAVWDDRIFVTVPIDEQDGVLCFDMQGKELWRKQLGKERPGKNPHATGSNSSPATNGKSVVVYFKSGTLACFALDGKEKWSINLQDKYGKDTLWWDLGTSPVIADGRVIVAVIQADDSYLVAFDLDSGAVAWKTPRNYKCPVECDQSYSTPQLAKSDGHDVLVTWGADHLTAHAVDTGKLVWECGGFNPDSIGNWRTIASPSVANGIAVVPYGRGAFLKAIRISGEGDITKSSDAWDKDELGADIPTAATRDGKLYLLTDKGRISCLALDSGRELWTANLPKDRNKFYASPVLAGDKLFCAREDGTVFVGEVSDTGFKLLATNPMGERMFATPVPIRGQLLLRGDDHLFMIGASGVATK
ncbi:MAG TPA: PQQ-binding-like beta-propeller repeat protein [Lacipirellulaceae bacterium]|jgi:outer membrane protein assembly factor BamB|nr:PQQ-binding-like beta-propeller repeat protein [Lacipirellulaceae bacterium]